MTNGQRVATGLVGLDEILLGGLPPRNLYLLAGAPGTGKTTIALHFLLEGARRGERCLYLGLSETRGQLASMAAAFGWSLDGIELHELRRRGATEAQRNAYTVFRPSEIELEEIAREILDQVERVRPSRLVLDSLSEIRLLSSEPYRYRRELLGLVDRLTEQGVTGWLIDVASRDQASDAAETITSGIVELEQLTPEYGGERRRLRVRKLRASGSVGGYHDFTIGARGVEIYPRLVAAEHRAVHSSAAFPSGIEALDALLGGGLDGGTSTVFSGPAGSGKSTLAALFVSATASRGEKGAMYCFEESPSNLLDRATRLGLPLAEQVEAGRVAISAVDPAELTPGQLASRVREDIDEGARIVVIDSLNGYLTAMPGERFIAAHLHELLAYLSEKGVATILTLVEHGVFGAETPINLSHLADGVVLLRYFEAHGAVRQAISVIKKRTGHHERTIRELRLGPDGIRVGEPLAEFRGVLSGTPEYVSGRLLGGRRDAGE